MSQSDKYLQWGRNLFSTCFLYQKRVKYFSGLSLKLYMHIGEIYTTINPGRTWKFPSTAALTCDRSFVSACVRGWCCCWGYNGRLMKVRAFLEIVHEAAFQLMLQLRGKDSPAVLWISLCAYVIRIHGTAVRLGASDSKMRWQEKRQRINTEDPE